jgi:hypothetical protein
LGAVSGTLAVVVTAVLETGLGLILMTGRGLRPGLVVMAGWLAAAWTVVAAQALGARLIHRTQSTP